MRNKVSKNHELSKNRTYKSLTVFLVTLILLSTFTFFVSTSAQDKNLVEKAELSFGVVDKASASLVFGEKNCTIKPLVFGSDFPYGNFTVTVSVNDSLTEVEKSDYTTIILFVISTILCIIGLALTVPLLPLISLTISVLNIIFLSEPTIFNILLTLLNVTFTVIALVRAKTKNN